jgi:hypothetical protein
MYPMIEYDYHWLVLISENYDFWIINKNNKGCEWIKKTRVNR